MITREELIAIGHYNKPHGLAGELSATLDVDADVLSSLSCLVSEVDGIFVPFFVNACRAKSAETVLITIDGIANEQEAAILVNHDIYALKREYSAASDDADADGYPLDYFIGYQLQDSDGTPLGVITDVDEQTEEELVSEKILPDAELLVVGHHGSKYSTGNALLSAVMPEAAVISVGENSYGHPSTEALSRLSAHGVMIYRTDTDGNISFRAE